MSATAFQLNRDVAGTLGARGELTFETAAAALEAITTALAAGRIAELDLAGVERSDSAGLACVLAAQAHAARLGRPLVLCNMPPNMHALARVCEVDALGG
jgi:phospholipid transport system transporter-binding protein